MTVEYTTIKELKNVINKNTDIVLCKNNGEVFQVLNDKLDDSLIEISHINGNTIYANLINQVLK